MMATSAKVQTKTKDDGDDEKGDGDDLEGVFTCLTFALVLNLDPCAAHR